MPHTPFAWPHSPKLEYYDSLTNLQVNVFMDLGICFHSIMIQLLVCTHHWKSGMVKLDG